MTTQIQREELRRMVEGGAQLVEVLPVEEYETEHLPGAMNIPLHTARPTSARSNSQKPT